MKNSFSNISGWQLAIESLSRGKIGLSLIISRISPCFQTSLLQTSQDRAKMLKACAEGSHRLIGLGKSESVAPVPLVTLYGFVLMDVFSGLHDSTRHAGSSRHGP